MAALAHSRVSLYSARMLTDMERSHSPTIPWFVWTSLISVSCIVAGTYWDISWHMTIGRDSFWTPAHLAIQAGGILGGAVGAVLIFATTFGKAAPLKNVSIGVWGFRGPFGAFLAAWGAVTMVVSAPFDNWWHSAYGLDVEILSPPHMVLTLGILSVALGGVVLAVAAMNRASGVARARMAWIVLGIGGEILVLSMIAILEQTFRSNLHSQSAYRAIAIVAPLILIALARVSDRRWAATMIAALYTAFMASMVWLFPLFPAEPKLGPVYQPITHFVPLEFPLLLLVPAFAIDLVRRPAARLAALAARAAARLRLHRHLGRRRVSVRDVHAVAGGRERFFRRRLLRLLHAARVVDAASPVFPEPGLRARPRRRGRGGRRHVMARPARG